MGLNPRMTRRSGSCCGASGWRSCSRRSIGLEREWRQKSAGLRTYTLVGLGSALFLLVCEFGFFDELERGQVVLDPSRVAAQIVSGIGFIGGGLIFVRRDSVRGLTTAAGVWLVAAVGMAAGAGLAVLAVASTLAYLLVTTTYPLLARRLPRSGFAPSPLRITYVDGRGVLREALARVTSAGFDVSDVVVRARRRTDHGRRSTVEVRGRQPLSGLVHGARRARRRACSVHAPTPTRTRRCARSPSSPARPARRGSTTCPSPPLRPARCSWTGSRSGSAARTARSCAASTAGRRPGRSGSCSATSRWGACSRRRRAPASRRATSWSASCDGPDAVPCAPCAAGEWDFCANGEYTERGIKQLHGYGSERWRVEPDFAIRLDPGLEDVGVLLEPTSVVAKAWEQIERIGARATFAARSVLVTGAGPIGLLAALLAVQRGYEVHVLDQVTDGPKPELVRAARRDLPRERRLGRRPGRHRGRGDGRGPGGRAGAARHDPQRDRLPHRRLVRRPPARLRHRRLQPRRRARERRGVRHRQRQPPPLRGGGGGARAPPTATGCAG